MAEENPTRNGPIWLPFVDKEVVVFFPNGTILGVLNRPNVDEGYIDFLPALVYNPDEETAYIEKDLPTRVALSLLQRGEVVIRLLKQGYLESRVASLNKAYKRKRGLIGFESESSKDST